MSNRLYRKLHEMLLKQKNSLNVNTLICIVFDYYLIESNNFTYIRLVGGRGPYEGRVEVNYGQWGTVCQDRFDINDANVVCRELGYPRAIQYYRRAHYGQGNGIIWLDDLSCTGTETSLYNCSHNGVNIHNCRHTQDVGVVCQGKANFIHKHAFH